MVVNIHTAKRTCRYAHHSITEMPPRKLEEFSRAVGGTRHSPPEQLPSHVGDVCSAVDPKRPAGHGEHVQQLRVNNTQTTLGQQPRHIALTAAHGTPQHSSSRPTRLDPLMRTRGTVHRRAAAGRQTRRVAERARVTRPGAVGRRERYTVPVPPDGARTTRRRPSEGILPRGTGMAGG